MSRRERVGFTLDTGRVKTLTEDEIKMILRAADELIATAGRSMLVKLLKGSRDKKVLEHKLDECPAYGFYRELTMEEISYRVDWMIEQDYLRIEYNGRLPMLEFSEKGWKIEEMTYAEELYQNFCRILGTGAEAGGSVRKAGKGGQAEALIGKMKDTNRQVVFEILAKIRASKNTDFLPILESWKAVEVRKVRERISSVERSLANRSEGPDIRFRKAGKNDWGEVMNLIHKTVLKTYPQYYPPEVADFFCTYHSKERIQADIQAGKVWVLRLDERIIGTGSVDGNHLDRLYVLPEFQGRGYGTRIIRELERQIGQKHGSVEMDASLPSVCLYEALGYHTAGHKKIHLMNGVVFVYGEMEKELTQKQSCD